MFWLVVSRSLGCSVVPRVFGVVAGVLYVVARAGILRFGLRDPLSCRV